MHWVRRVAGLESRAVGKGPLVLSQRDPRASWAWTFRTMDRDRGDWQGAPRGRVWPFIWVLPCLGPLGHIPGMIPGVALSDGTVTGWACSEGCNV